MILDVKIDGIKRRKKKQSSKTIRSFLMKSVGKSVELWTLHVCCSHLATRNLDNGDRNNQRPKNVDLCSMTKERGFMGKPHFFLISKNSLYFKNSKTNPTPVDLVICRFGLIHFQIYFISLLTLHFHIVSLSLFTTLYINLFLSRSSYLKQSCN